MLDFSNVRGAGGGEFLLERGKGRCENGLEGGDVGGHIARG